MFRLASYHICDMVRETNPTTTDTRQIRTHNLVLQPLHYRNGLCDNSLLGLHRPGEGYLQGFQTSWKTGLDFNQLGVLNPGLIWVKLDFSQNTVY